MLSLSLMVSNVLGIWAPSGPELVIVLVIALLLFGKRLPEVARSLGKGVVEFKKGIKGIEEEVDNPQGTAEPYRAPPKISAEAESTGEGSKSS